MRSYSYVAFASVFAARVHAQITGTYPVQLVATGTPAPGDGTDLSSYPECARACGTSFLPLLALEFANTSTAEASCSSINRGNTSACEAITCNDADYLRAAALAPDLCQPVYEASPAVSSAASAAIATETAFAQAAVAGKDETDLKVYPACAQSCIPPALAAGGCHGLSDRECACRCELVAQLSGECETRTCQKEDIRTLIYLVEKLCAPVAGQYPKLASACRSAGNGTTPSGSQATGSPPTPTSPGSGSTVPFTGDGEVVRVGGLVILTVALTLLLGCGAY